VRGAGAIQIRHLTRHPCGNAVRRHGKPGRRRSEREIDFLELIWIQRRGAPYLFRTGQLPPLRGTSVQLDPNTLLLYTRGSIPYFHTYPGMYVPQPLLLRPAGDGTDLQGAGADVMALSKMNWNNAQRDPLTLRTAHRVGAILRHVPPDAQIATRYAYYM
jgi:hypothetical protein